MDIDFKAVFGEKANDDNILTDNSYLKVSGTYGNIDAKVDEQQELQHLQELLNLGILIDTKINNLLIIK